MVDVLSATGNVWQTLMRTTATTAPFRVRVVSTNRESDSVAATEFPSNQTR
jgi:hypothetical protein